MMQLLRRGNSIVHHMPFLRRGVFTGISCAPRLLCRQLSVIGSDRDADTIYALCSGQMTKSGVAVIRVSGSNAFEAIKRMTKVSLPFPDFRTATLRSVLDSNTGEVIDRGLILCFKEGSSYTTENVVEFHLHGSPAVISATLKSLSRISSFRSAEAGEFTKRAFLNGNMSFLDVEALGDLLNAETEQQRKQAIIGMNGPFNRMCWKWRDLLMHSLAHAETILDFSDDVDDESAQLADASKNLLSIRNEMKQQLHGFQHNAIIKNGFCVTLCGPPNAGKSSLLNLLVGSEMAIVSSTPGTTRDVLRVDMDLDGYKVLLQDTAGIRQSTNELECEGMKRARAAVAESMLRVVIVDVCKEAEEATQEVLNEMESKKTLIVLNKIDLVSEETVRIVETNIKNKYPGILGVVPISCVQQKEIHTLTECIATYVKKCMETSEENNSCLITRERQRNCIEQCITSIDNCIELANESLVDMQAEEIKSCLKSLGRLTGDVDVEDILDIVFSDFCIGK